MSSRVLELWEERIRNWALWRVSGNGSAGVSNAYRDEWWRHPPRQPVPLVGEALDTDTLIQRLCDEHRQAIEAVYVWTVPERFDDRAARLRIHPNSLRERIRQAKFRLDDMDQARRAPHARRVA